MEPLLWSILLLVIGIALIFLEVFVPSGGMLSVLAILAVVASIIVAFTGGWQTGLIMLMSSLVIIPLVIGAAIKWWPETPIGRLVVLQRPSSEEDVLPDPGWTRRQQELIGRTGVAKTKMLPSGAIVIDGETYDAVSDGVAIDAGQPVRIVAVRTNRLIVRPDDGSPPASSDASDALSLPARTLGIDSLEDPPT
jgi:membrane-bound serine protease (ClpP class)